MKSPDFRRSSTSKTRKSKSEKIVKNNQLQLNLSPTTGYTKGEKLLGDMDQSRNDEDN